MIDLVTFYPELPEALEIKRQRVGQASLSDIGALAFELQQFERIAAVGALFLELDTDGFLHALMRCAWTRIHLLRRTPPAQREQDRYCRASRLEGFADALAARRFDLASQIAELSPKQWANRCEYEDDFCYAKLLHGESRRADRDAQVALLERFQQVLEGAASTRYDVCHALIERDADAFHDAFYALLTDWEKEVEFQRTSFGRDEFAFAADRYLFIEGLALLALAENLGFSLFEDYPFCPAEARRPLQTPLPEHTHLR